jgi:predicted dehydrogenase
MNSRINRRSFLKSTLAASAALSLPARVRAAAEGANSDIRIAVIGFNSRGQDHIKNYQGMKGVRIVALCDTDSNVLEKSAAALRGKSIQVQTYSDIRKLLESKEIDAVSIATPNHWHSLGAIWACQAGKDVYVEKPVSHNVWEGRQLVKAADVHQRIVQMGVQSRSGAGLAEALEWVKSAPLGKLKFARGLCYKPRPSIGKTTGDQPIPSSVDYDLWSGPAPVVPPRRNGKFGPVHYDWHWVWNYGNGDLGNQGIHQMDIARRFTGESELPPAVFAVGGRLGYLDDGETPNSMFVFHDYKAAPLIFEVRGLPEKKDSKAMDKIHGVSVGVIVQYENGYIVCPDYNNAAAYSSDGQLIRKFGNPPMAREAIESSPAKPGEKQAPSVESENHYANFIKAVRSRKVVDLNGKIHDGHISSALCHTGNISYLLGKKAAPEVLREKLTGNKEGMESLDRLAGHLEANEVDLKTDQLTVGEFLKMDPKTEKFVGNAAADRMLTREYRAPFIVPASV